MEEGERGSGRRRRNKEEGHEGPRWERKKRMQGNRPVPCSSPDLLQHLSPCSRLHLPAPRATPPLSGVTPQSQEPRASLGAAFPSQLPSFHADHLQRPCSRGHGSDLSAGGVASTPCASLGRAKEYLDTLWGLGKSYPKN